VINQIRVGCGWLSARHAMGKEPFHEALRQALRAWLLAAVAPAEPIDIMLSGDCNPLQAHPRLTERVLVCPAEPCLGDGVLTLQDVWLRLDPQSGLIEMFADQKRVAPIYLGTTVPNRAWGFIYWLIVLATPWRLRPSEPAPSHVPAAAVHHTPRHVVGRIVIRRASWLISIERLRNVWFRRGGSMMIADVSIDCAKLGIPRWFFVVPSGSPNDWRSKTRKPIWVDCRNPYMLDVLRNLSQRAEMLLITEALPARATWPNLSGIPHVSEFQTEVML
jgi:hypothetical protein